jgi:hypothetical protein
MVAVADQLVPVGRRVVVLLAVVARRQHSFVGQAEPADLKALSLNRDPLNRRKSCTPNEVDERKEIHRQLCRAQLDLHRCFAVDGLFGAAFHSVVAEENWFELVQAWNLREYEE